MEEEKGFVIKDKRTFSAETGEPNPEAPQKDEGKKASKEEPATPEKKRKPETEETCHLPEVSFSTFVFSLSSSALLHFGEIPDPTTGQTNNSHRAVCGVYKHTFVLAEKRKLTINMTKDPNKSSFDWMWTHRKNGVCFDPASFVRISSSVAA